MTTRGTLGFLWALPVLLPAVCVWLGSFALAHGTDRPGMLEPDVMVSQSALVASPFVVLAALATVFARRLRPRLWVQAGVVGALLTLALWAYYFYDGYVYWRDGATSGADFGVAFLMLLSPVIVGFGMWVAALLAKRRG